MKTENLDFKEFSFLIEKLIKKLNLLNRDQKNCCGLTMPQCWTIEALSQNGMLTMNKLSREMGVTRSTMTRIIDVLVRDDITGRKNNLKDRRQIFIELTDKGKKLSVRLKQCSERYSKYVLDELPVKKRGDIISLLKILNTAVNKVHGKYCC